MTRAGWEADNKAKWCPVRGFYDFHKGGKSHLRRPSCQCGQGVLEGMGYATMTCPACDRVLAYRRGKGTSIAVGRLIFPRHKPPKGLP